MIGSQKKNWDGLRERLAARLGADWGQESAAVLRAVATHRDYWKPPEVRVLLLAESHVLTQQHELAATVKLDPHGHSGAPSEFVRLVYCLGYGEDELLSAKPSNNGGTPQFWKLLAACVGDPNDAQVLKTTEPDLRRRIAAKIRLLEELRSRGVWLLDASPVALYRSGGGKPRRKELRAALEVAWDEYSGAIVREVAPLAVMVIGRMVHDALGERVKGAVGSGVDVQWMYQPQARVSAAEHASGLTRLRRMVEAHGRR